MLRIQELNRKRVRSRLDFCKLVPCLVHDYLGALLEWRALPIDVVLQPIYVPLEFVCMLFKVIQLLKRPLIAKVKHCQGKIEDVRDEVGWSYRWDEY